MHCFMFHVARNVTQESVQQKIAEACRCPECSITAISCCTHCRTLQPSLETHKSCKHAVFVIGFRTNQKPSWAALSLVCAQGRACIHEALVSRTEADFAASCIQFFRDLNTDQTKKRLSKNLRSTTLFMV